MIKSCQFHESSNFSNTSQHCIYNISLVRAPNNNSQQTQFQEEINKIQCPVVSSIEANLGPVAGHDSELGRVMPEMLFSSMPMQSQLHTRRQ